MNSGGIEKEDHQVCFSHFHCKHYQIENLDQSLIIITSIVTNGLHVLPMYLLLQLVCFF